MCWVYEYAYVSVATPRGHRCWIPESPGVTGGCESTDMGPGIWTQISWETRKSA